MVTLYYQSVSIDWPQKKLSFYDNYSYRLESDGEGQKKIALKNEKDFNHFMAAGGEETPIL